MGNIDAKRDWGHARDYVEMMWMMLQQASGVVPPLHACSDRQSLFAPSRRSRMITWWRQARRTPCAPSSSTRSRCMACPRLVGLPLLPHICSRLPSTLGAARGRRWQVVGINIEWKGKGVDEVARPFVLGHARPIAKLSRCYTGWLRRGKPRARPRAHRLQVFSPDRGEFVGSTSPQAAPAGLHACCCRWSCSLAIPPRRRPS